MELHTKILCRDGEYSCPWYWLCQWAMPRGKMEFTGGLLRELDLRDFAVREVEALCEYSAAVHERRARQVGMPSASLLSYIGAPAGDWFELVRRTQWTADTQPFPELIGALRAACSGSSWRWLNAQPNNITEILAWLRQAEWAPADYLLEAAPPLARACRRRILRELAGDFDGKPCSVRANEFVARVLNMSLIFTDASPREVAEKMVLVFKKWIWGQAKTNLIAECIAEGVVPLDDVAWFADQLA